nr:hypothetical protein [Anaerococcus urinomassiliensis]
MKKLAKLLDRVDKNRGDTPPSTEGIASLFEKIIYFRINIEKASTNRIYEVGFVDAMNGSVNNFVYQPKS